ncbi:MAG: hypothetical protein DRI93_00610 [Aquificota bacterium]|nr:MAG: hypothetical protein DRI93_00610 [Aquificota bacterium]
MMLWRGVLSSWATRFMKVAWISLFFLSSFTVSKSSSSRACSFWESSFFFQIFSRDAARILAMICHAFFFSRFALVFFEGNTMRCPSVVFSNSIVKRHLLSVSPAILSSSGLEKGNVKISLSPHGGSIINTNPSRPRSSKGMSLRAWRISSFSFALTI